MAHVKDGHMDDNETSEFGMGFKLASIFLGNKLSVFTRVKDKCYQIEFDFESMCLNKDANDYVRRVNVILRKNRRILSKLMPGDKSRTTKEQLLIRGFNFYYYTNIYKTKQGKTYFFVYELGYLELENEDYALVRKQDYVK